LHDGQAGRPAQPRPTHAPAPAETSTRREQQVSASAAQGATAAQIGAASHISPSTARKHRENSMRKLASHSTAESRSIRAALDPRDACSTAAARRWPKYGTRRPWEIAGSHRTPPRHFPRGPARAAQDTCAPAPGARRGAAGVPVHDPQHRHHAP
ncbi:hypothetical protein OY671_009963, partial [Metschnikowia pulcherrima]